MTEVIEILSDGDEEFIRPNPSARQDFGSASGVINVSSEPPEESSSLDLDQVTAQVLEIVPDVALDYLEDMIIKLLERGDSRNFVERVLHSLLENSSYPKNEQTKGKKRKRESPDEEGPATKVSRQDIDYASNDRPYKGGPHYQQLALNQLFTDFPYIPTSYIKGALRKNSSLYGPTHLRLLTEQSSPNPPFRLKSAQTKVAGKSTANDDEYLAERAWLEHHLEAIAQSNEQTMTQILEGEEDFECACCFTSYSFETMIQCSEGHLYCRTCIVKYAETELGQQKCAIVCMDQGGCKEPFPETELKRVLTAKLLELYDRIKQRKEIAAADIEGLEECPFCDFKVVIENLDEKLLRCQHDDCLAITCRSCKRLDHLPRSCKEVEQDNVLNGRHAVEEALSEALMRKCPKCKTNIVKEYGCNKMTCSQCHTLFCNICQKAIEDYNHFSGPGLPNRSGAGQCPLYDGSAQITQQMENAAKEAAQKFRTENPDIDEKDLAVEVPKASGSRYLDPRMAAQMAAQAARPLPMARRAAAAFPANLGVPVPQFHHPPAFILPQYIPPPAVLQNAAMPVQHLPHPPAGRAVPPPVPAPHPRPPAARRRRRN